MKPARLYRTFSVTQPTILGGFGLLTEAAWNRRRISIQASYDARVPENHEKPAPKQVSMPSDHVGDHPRTTVRLVALVL